MFSFQNGKKIVTIIVLVTTAIVSAQAESHHQRVASVLSFSEWKKNTKEDINQKVQLLEQLISEEKRTHANDRKKMTENLTSQLTAEKTKLANADDLSLHEYFIGYLLLQKDLDKKITELSKILKPEEVRQLMASYGDLVNKLKDEGKHGYNSRPIDE